MEEDGDDWIARGRTEYIFDIPNAEEKGDGEAQREDTVDDDGENDNLGNGYGGILKRWLGESANVAKTADGSTHQFDLLSLPPTCG